MLLGRDEMGRAKEVKLGDLMLHRALEGYAVPRRLVGRATPTGPAPRRLPIGPLMNFGYEDEALLHLVEIVVPATASGTVAGKTRRPGTYRATRRTKP